ncbi:MAG: hypothetical protein H0W74_05340 [Sphingosinicella sp.]|nr:hypothetical protein [Sphingosinicella sp.]
MKFSYSAVWDDTARMLRDNASLLLAIAGAFLFLPALIVGYALPQPDPEPGRIVGVMIAYFSVNWHWLLLANIVNMIGAIAMLLLLVGAERRTVGSAIVAALSILPFYFVAAILTNILVILGLIALIVPGLYLIGRLAVVGTVIVAENQNPGRAIGRSFMLTKGKGWVVFGLLALVLLAGIIVSWAVTAVLGSVSLLILGDRIGGLLVIIFDALTSALLSTIIVVLCAAIYRRLAGSGERPVN